jgi:UDP-N-acetylmuramoyl-tripeptide--D-alanyl-D-alanine ligase
MKLRTSDILTLPHHEAMGFDGLNKFSITGISLDSRKIKAGEMFVAIRGDRFDGHDFISKAIEMDAACLLVERRWADANKTMMVSIHIPRLIVENTYHALGHLATMYRRKYSIPFIAVGGSNGKTTTKEMLKNILSTKYCVLCTEGNFNNHIGVPQTLFRLESKHEIAIIELGTNHPGEIKYLCSVLEPTHGLITNIGHEHLEFFGSIEGVAKAEGELFDWLAKHKGASFVNADDKYLVRLSKKVKRRTTFGMSARRTAVRGTILSCNADAQALLRIKSQTKKPFDITVGVPGSHNAQNALAATTVGLAFKVPSAKIQNALTSFHSADKRMQVQKLGKVIVLNDTYNANPDSVLAALATLHLMASKGKKIAVLADMLELGLSAEKFHQLIGQSLARYGVDILITFGTLSKQTHDGASIKTKTHFENKIPLIEHLFHTIGDDDIILVKGSRGMKMEEVVLALNERLSEKAGN